MRRKPCLDLTNSTCPLLWDLPGFKPFFPDCGSNFQALFPLLLLLLLSVVEESSGSHGGMSKPNLLSETD